MKSGHLGVLIIAGIVSACGSSAPTHFYTLSTQPAPAAADSAEYPMRTVALGEVKLPDALDRPQIARQIGPNQLEFAEADRWAGPLDDMVRRVLAADLRPLLPAGTALVPNDSSTPAQVTVAVEVSRFDADKSGRVTLDATWAMLDKNAKVVGASRPAKIVEPGSGSDSAAVAATMSRAVGGLADNIAGRLGGGSLASMR